MLQHRFGVSFEQVCHRLTTLQRPGHEGIPFHLIRVDIAGKTVMPHAPYFGPGYWATAQIMSARPECGLFERFYLEPEGFCGEAIPLPVAGQITVPDVPGLGFVPDRDVIQRYRVG